MNSFNVGNQLCFIVPSRAMFNSIGSASFISYSAVVMYLPADKSTPTLVSSCGELHLPSHYFNTGKFSRVAVVLVRERNEIPVPTETSAPT